MPPWIGSAPTSRPTPWTGTPSAHGWCAADSLPSRSTASPPTGPDCSTGTATREPRPAGFQAELESAARRRVVRAARLVAAKTAVTPRSIDTAIVLHAALAMVGDLCRIFQLRLGTLGTAVVLGRAFALAYLSGQLQQATETLTRDAAADGAGQLLHGLPEGIGQVGSKLAGALAPKVAEGTANGILLWRLGAATIRLLRPVAPIQK